MITASFDHGKAMIQFFIGPYRSGKTGHLLSRLIEYKRDHVLDSCLILVPSKRYERLLRTQLETLLRSTAGDQKGIFGLRIATVDGACRQILRNAGVATNVLPRNVCLELVAQSLDHLHEQGGLNYLSTIRQFKGTSNAVLELIEEFEKAAFTPAEVLAKLQTTASSSSRHYELATVYKEYCRRLDDLAAVDKKRLLFLCREILSRKSVDGFRLRWLMVDGFDRVNPLQAEIIKALSEHTVETAIAFDYLLKEERSSESAQTDEYAWKDSSYNELHKRLLVQPSFIAAPTQIALPQEHVFKTSDAFAEIQEVARRCKAAIVRRGTKPGQILVVARDVHSYAVAVQAAFDSAGLPYYLDESIALTSLPLVKSILSLLRLHINDFPRREVIDTLRCQYVDAQSFGFKPKDIDRLNKRSLDAKVISGRAQWLKVLDRTTHAELATKISNLFDCLTPKDTASVEHYCRWVEDTLEKVMGQALLGDQRTLASFAENNAVSGIREALKSLLLKENLFGQRQLSYSQFFSALESLLSNSNFRSEEPTSDHVYICSAEHAPNRRFDEVFVAGAIEGSFPKHSGGSGLLSTDERNRWASFGIELINPREEPGYERALFKSLVRRARKNFTASYPQCDLSSNELVPSCYLSDSTMSLCAVENVGPAAGDAFAPYSAKEAIASWLWQAPGPDLPDALRQNADVADCYELATIPLLSVNDRHQSHNKSVYNGYLADLKDSGWLSLELPHTWSPSSINNYGQCPFKYWVSNILKMEPHEEPESGLSLQDKGKLYHRILELYYAKAGATDLEVKLNETLSVAFTELESSAEFRPSPYWSNEKREITFRIRRFLQYDQKRISQDGQPTPGLLETKFGWHDSPYPALQFQTDAGTIKVRGIIDRVDVVRSEDGTIERAEVIDYKSGSGAITVAEALDGANLQIPLYALAVERSILPGTKVSDGHYLSVNAAKSIGSIGFNKEKTAHLLKLTEEHVNRIISGVAAGDFTVSPYSSKACKSCPQQSTCRIGELSAITGEDTLF